MEQPQRISVEIKGTTGYIQDRFIQRKEENNKRGKKVYDPKIEAEEATYKDENGYYIPSTQIEASMIKASTEHIVKGKKTYKDFIKSGLIIKEEKIKLSQQSYTILETPVVIQRARIIKAKPVFKDWSAKFTIEILDKAYLNPAVIKQILEDAGRFKGLGDWRPKYGRFEIVNWKVLN